MTTLDEKSAIWSDGQKPCFPESFSINLAVTIRSVWSGGEAPADVKIPQIKWLNEIHRRVPMRAQAVRMDHDPSGRPRPPLQLRSAYGPFAVIYRGSPAGLPLPSPGAFPKAWPERRPWRTDGLNRLLQELGGDAVRQRPLGATPEK